MRTVRTTFLSIISVLTIAYAAAAYELPEVIGVLEEEGIFASDFCWVGDQNDDGCDDLLIKYTAGNQALLYYGDEQMENEPGFIFEPYLEQQEVCQRINFLGNIRPDCEPYIAFFSLVRSDPSNILLNLYEVGNAIDNDPEVSFSRIFRENSLFIGSGYKTRPCNNSNDVFCDLVSIREEPPITKLLRVC